MDVTCMECGVRIVTRNNDEGRGRLAANGWTSFLVSTDEYWRCPECSKAPKSNIPGWLHPNRRLLR